MMSRRKIFPSFNSSRQMMIAWKVSGLSHSPAIIASRPASMRLARTISPSRERSWRPSRADTCAPDRRSAESALWPRIWPNLLLTLDHHNALALVLLVGLLAFVARLLGV